MNARTAPESLHGGTVAPDGDDLEGQYEAGEETAPTVKARSFIPRFLRLKRTPFRALSIGRLMRGGRLNDVGRFPRYVLIFLLIAPVFWAPIVSYVMFAPERFTSNVALILPGTGVSSSVNLSEIGQATTSSNSPYSSSAISPTVTYQKFIQSDRVVDRASEIAGTDVAAYGRPRITLVDQTSLLRIEMRGPDPKDAQMRTQAILDAFLTEMDELRTDEIQRREASTVDTVRVYQESVDQIRDKISALQLDTGLSSTGQFADIVTAKENLLREIAQNEAELESVSNLVTSLAGLLDISPESAAKTLQLNADPEYEIMVGALSDEAAKLASLEKLYGPRHPEVLDVKRRQNGIRAQMLTRAVAITGLGVEELQTEVQRTTEGQTGELMTELVSEVAKRDGLRGRQRALRNELEALELRISELVGAASELDKLNRDYKVAEAVFTTALARLNASKTDLFASYPMVQIAEPPNLPRGPSSPNRILAIAAGIVATVFLIIGLMLGWLRRPLIDRVSKALGTKGGDADAVA
ncbi:GumC family protein [Oricola sp.]|uniref:GumC family protein n=1 Tax=Oricola sp. TaxID=1979950 RepID=UPI003BAA2284